MGEDRPRLLASGTVTLTLTLTLTLAPTPTLTPALTLTPPLTLARLVAISGLPFGLHADMLGPAAGAANPIEP